jgi:RNA polymerase sigma factor (sigma-70 family)
VREYRVNTERQEEVIAAAVKVFAEHGSFIRTVIRLRIPDVSRREDLFQELFLRLVDRPVPAEVENVRGYLYRMILRDAIDLEREQEQEQRHLKKYVARSQILIYKSLSPNAILEETKEKDSVFACLIGQLRRREAQVMTLRYQDNYSVAEIAAEIGIDRRSVSRYLTSGLRELRRQLAVE